jgi:hypothetical protein
LVWTSAIQVACALGDRAGVTARDDDLRVPAEAQRTVGQQRELGDEVVLRDLELDDADPSVGVVEARHGTRPP